MNYFINTLRRNWIGRSIQNSGRSNNIIDKMGLVRLDMFLIVVVATFKRSFCSQRMVLAKLVEAAFHSEE